MSVPTVSEFFEQTFIVLWIKGRLDPKTEKSYRESVRHFINLVGDLPLDQITDVHTAMYVTKLAEQPGKQEDTMMRSSVAKPAVRHGRRLLV